MEKIEALAKFLGEDIEDISEGYDENTFECGRREYKVYTEDEADEAVKDYIRESVWAFNASFLADQTELPSEVFECMQEKCEGANDAVLKLVEKTCGLDEFVSEAVSSDGRGHFLSGYDGEEIEEDEYYIYRTN